MADHLAGAVKVFPACSVNLTVPLRSNRPILVLVALLLLHGCAASPADQLARSYGLDSTTVEGQGFSHQLFMQRGAGNLLHVYLEGDGLPWVTQERIARDPTPAKPLMLELMTQDTAPSVFLGRPCYFNLADPACSPRWWTDQRYATEVVASLDAVLDTLVAEYSGLVLIGHSGGGALAMLLAAIRDDMRMVVTLAGNLNTQAWADAHGYTPLYGSLDPAQQPPLPGGIAQLHLIGEHDAVISYAMLSAALQQQSAARVWQVPGVDHSCCWGRLWPEVLAEVQAAVAVPPIQRVKTPSDPPG